MKHRLIVAASEQDADLLYAVGIFVPDPFIYLETRGRRLIVISDLEIDRARRHATVDRVLSYNRYLQQLKRRGVRQPRMADVLRLVLRQHRIRTVEVPATFPLGLARKLPGVRLQPVSGAFFPERARKTLAEVRHIESALRIAEAGMQAALDMLRRSRIGRDGYLYRQRSRLTAEAVQGHINATVARAGGVASHTIVAGGNQGCDPHETGHGPLRAHWPIIVDIFPRDLRTGYFGDITRTVVRGRASERVRRMYAAVQQAQQLAFAKLRAGVDGQSVHDAILRLFRQQGFPTGRRHGRMQGFFHGTGHGLGLEVHEAPRVGAVAETLQAGHVVTVEPGLYYWGSGGVRLEDVALISQRGARNLTQFSQQLEI